MAGIWWVGVGGECFSGGAGGHISVPTRVGTICGTIRSKPVESVENWAISKSPVCSRSGVISAQFGDKGKSPGSQPPGCSGFPQWLGGVV